MHGVCMAAHPNPNPNPALGVCAPLQSSVTPLSVCPNTSMAIPECRLLQGPCHLCLWPWQGSCACGPWGGTSASPAQGLCLGVLGAGEGRAW